MLPVYQVNRINCAYDNFSLGIYCPRNAEGSGKSYSAFPSKSMIINQEDDSITGSYMRDMDFSFIVKNNTSFEVGLFLYNNKHIKMQNIRDYYKTHGIVPNNSNNFHHIGIYTIDFDVNNISDFDRKRNHFNISQPSDDNRNYMKFDFYFMYMDPNQHQNVTRGRNDIYYISNPTVTFNIDEIM